MINKQIREYYIMIIVIIHNSTVHKIIIDVNIVQQNASLHAL